MQPHPTQLAICHELISAEVTVHEGRQERRRQWCNLAAHAWCFYDEHYVCELHVTANHQHHRLQLVSDEKASAEHPDRRSGGDRRTP